MLDWLKEKKDKATNLLNDFKEHNPLSTLVEGTLTIHAGKKESKTESQHYSDEELAQMFSKMALETVQSNENSKLLTLLTIKATTLPTDYKTYYIAGNKNKIPLVLLLLATLKDNTLIKRYGYFMTGFMYDKEQSVYKKLKDLNGAIKDYVICFNEGGKAFDMIERHENNEYKENHYHKLSWDVYAKKVANLLTMLSPEFDTNRETFLIVENPSLAEFNKQSVYEQMNSKIIEALEYTLEQFADELKARNVPHELDRNTWMLTLEGYEPIINDFSASL